MTPSQSPTNSPTPTQSPTNTPTPTVTVSVTPTITPTASVTPTPSPSAVASVECNGFLTGPRDNARTGTCIFAKCQGSSHIYFDYENNVTEAACLENNTSSHFFPADLVEKSQIDFHVSPDRCTQPKDITLSTAWTRYDLTFDIPELQGKVIGNGGNDYLAVQFWTHDKNGACDVSTHPGSEHPGTPRNENESTNNCPDPAVCEPCGFSRFTSTHYAGTMSLAQVQLEQGLKFTKFHRVSERKTMDQCKRFYELSECNHTEVSKPFLGAMSSGLIETVQLQEEKRVTPQVTIYDTVYDNASSVAVSNITSNKFVVTADAGASKGKAAMDFTYEADAELYRYNEQVAVLE